MDIGTPAVSGNSTFSNHTFSVDAAGTDIWGTADQFHFVYHPMSGDGEVTARVASLPRTHPWAKAGVMIRESLTARSRYAMALLSASQGYAFQRRFETAGQTVNTSGGSGTAPGWVRLVRTGNLFEAFRSADGAEWTPIGSDTIMLGETVYVGLAVTSHDARTATTALIDNVQITSARTANANPTVSITAPAFGAQYAAPATVPITAAASDPEGRMASVDFYVESTLIARDTTAPYSAEWPALTAGTYALTAVAHDADGGSTTSGVVTVTVQAPANAPPTVSITAPASGAQYTAPDTVSITAAASDPEGQLARVEFFAGTTRLATDTTAPYAFDWIGVAAGTYSVTAVAYDAEGASATSSAVTVTVGNSTVLTPPRLVVFTASADHSTNVDKYVLKVSAFTVNPLTGVALATSDLGKPVPASTGEITVDRELFFSALPAGSYVATVTAIGPGGQTPSAGVAFTR